MTRCRAVAWAAATVVVAACGGGAPARRADEDPERPTGVAVAPVSVEDDEVTDPRARAQAGGWSGAGLEPPPHYCNDEGGTEWCDGEHDDDCDGQVDEGCVDCVRQTCVRYRISEEDAQRGAGREGGATCVGPVYCGRIDGYATTEPPGGCGDFHCGTVIWSDGTAQPNHCTIYGRCEGGEFTARGFSW